jgi:hypothetical protein
LPKKKYSRRRTEMREIPGGKKATELTASWAEHTIDGNLEQKD